MVEPAPLKPLTPAMAQWHRWKQEHPTELLFFRMGDFYELFFDDAKIASRVLGLTLTSRSKGEDAIPMAGVPVRSVDHHLKRLVRLGHRVAICEQMEDPDEAEGLVERAVVRIVTAGTLTEEDLLDRATPNFLAALHRGGDGKTGLAFVELSTGRFVVEVVGDDEAADALLRRDAAELLVSEGASEPKLVELLRERVPATTRPAWQFERSSALESLLAHFKTASLDGFGLDDRAPYVEAAGAVLRYLEETQKTALDHLNPPRHESTSDRLALDRATRSCLELTETAREGKREGSLLWVLDQTATAMGARQLREWLLAPLLDVAPIVARQGAIAELVGDGGLRARIGDTLRSIADLERLLTRVVTQRANGRDLVAIRNSLAQVPKLRTTLQTTNAALLSTLQQALDPLPDLAALLQRALVDEPPATIKDGGLIRAGHHVELDELRALQSDAQSVIAQMQAREIERTGIATLKVGFNRVFGFYIEITNANSQRVPADYIRKQTLKNAERFVTPELKEYEAKVLTAEERSKALEFELFQELRGAVAHETDRIKATADAIGTLDVLLSLAQVAALHGYARPDIDDGDALVIEDGRHPVLLNTRGAARFVPNGCTLIGATRRLGIVTGPNMAGKSTYIRQVALLQILAQIGSFVPAKAMRCGVVDRVFARVGASDDLARGNSTFMVEMAETANILNNATDKSLIILDEVGRGTSTFDGLAIAWAISEHLLNTVKARALFATHYHQLIALAETYPAVVNLNVAVREWGDEIVFLHQIVEGGSDRSYGIHVARLAGVPKPVLLRANEILRQLEASSPDLRKTEIAKGSPDGGARAPATAPSPAKKAQPSLFDPPSPEKEVAKQLKALDLDRMTPIDALMALKKLRDELGR